MRARSMTMTLVLAAALAAPMFTEIPRVEAAGKKAKLVCTGKGTARKCRRAKRGKFMGHGVAQIELRTEPLPRPSGWVHVISPALHEEITVNIYNPDGSYNEESLAQLDALFRCRKTQEVRAVDPRLYEILSVIYDHFGQKTVQLASGFRYQKNEGSRHFHGSAMDISIPGISFHTIYEFANTLDRGGMGIGQYPGDGFVHVDFRAPGEPSYRWTDTGSKQGRSGRVVSPLWRKTHGKSNS